MDIFAPGIFDKVLESQGVIGLLLMISIAQQWTFYKKCIEQRYKLTQFIMTCLEKEADYNHTRELATTLGVEIASKTIEERNAQSSHINPSEINLK